MTQIEEKIVDCLKQLGVSHMDKWKEPYGSAFTHEFRFRGVVQKLNVLDIAFFYSVHGLDEETVIDRTVKEILLALLNKKKLKGGFENFYDKYA